jgi:ATP-dependent helicase HrpA
MLKEKITVMLRALPKNIRRNLVPVPETAKECAANLRTGEKGLAVNLAEYLFRSRGIHIPDDAWQAVSIPDHLLFNIRVVDEENAVLGQSRNLDELKNRFSKQLQGRSSAISSAGLYREGITRWDFDELPAEIKIEISKMPVSAWPALVDMGDSVSICSFDTREKSEQNMRAGLKRLFMLELDKDFKYLRKNLAHMDEISLVYSTIGKVEELKNDLINLVAEQVFIADKPEIRTKPAFNESKTRGSAMLVIKANEISALVRNILKIHNEINLGLKDKSLLAAANSMNDIRQHLTSLVYPGFLQKIPMILLKHYPRYLDAIRKRVEKLTYAPQKDEIQLNKLKPYWMECIRLEELNRNSDNISPNLTEFRFMLEEYRVSLFAQELGTAITVSPERLQRQLDAIRKLAAA